MNRESTQNIIWIPSHYGSKSILRKVMAHLCYYQISFTSHLFYHSLFTFSIMFQWSSFDQVYKFANVNKQVYKFAHLFSSLLIFSNNFPLLSATSCSLHCKLLQELKERRPGSRQSSRWSRSSSSWRRLLRSAARERASSAETPLGFLTLHWDASWGGSRPQRRRPVWRFSTRRRYPIWWVGPSDSAPTVQWRRWCQRQRSWLPLQRPSSSHLPNEIWAAVVLLFRGSIYHS